MFQTLSELSIFYVKIIAVVALIIMTLIIKSLLGMMLVAVFLALHSNIEVILYKLFLSKFFQRLYTTSRDSTLPVKTIHYQ